jgi:hypothetical protein
LRERSSTSASSLWTISACVGVPTLAVLSARVSQTTKKVTVSDVGPRKKARVCWIDVLT